MEVTIMSLENQRNERIRRTARIVASRSRVWQWSIGRCPINPVSSSNWLNGHGPQLVSGRHRKGRPLSCGCAKRRKGQPKIAAGLCDIGCHKGLFELRRKNRDLANWGSWFGAGTETWDWDSDEAYLLLDAVGWCKWD
jgi:hypothetical protein